MAAPRGNPHVRSDAYMARIHSLALGRVKQGRAPESYNPARIEKSYDARLSGAAAAGSKRARRTQAKRARRKAAGVRGERDAWF